MTQANRKRQKKTNPYFNAYASESRLPKTKPGFRFLCSCPKLNSTSSLSGRGNFRDFGGRCVPLTSIAEI